jgi:hypothetical protein
MRCIYAFHILVIYQSMKWPLEKIPDEFTLRFPSAVSSEPDDEINCTLHLNPALRITMLGKRATERQSVAKKRCSE